MGWSDDPTIARPDRGLCGQPVNNIQGSNHSYILYRTSTSGSGSDTLALKQVPGCRRGDVNEGGQKDDGIADALPRVTRRGLAQVEQQEAADEALGAVHHPRLSLLLAIAVPCSWASYLLDGVQGSCNCSQRPEAIVASDHGCISFSN